MAQMKMQNDMRCDFLVTIFVLELFPASFDDNDNKSFGCIAELAG